MGQAHWLETVVGRVEARLSGFLGQKRGEASGLSPEACELVDAVAELTMRGGKRLRPAALYAAYRAVRPEGDLAQTLDLCAALELLQSYFLIQDDWMDGDEQRRGGPAVHVALAKRRGSAQLGASLAMLAADVASGFAWELVARAPFAPGRLAEGLLAFSRMHFEVVAGQQLDILGHADVALVHQLKTGSYTVRGPLRLGGLLADGSAAQLAALERFGAPLGLAFQLRDDLLSAFGSEAAIGKPVGNDLRAGKRTALIAEARTTLGPTDVARLDAVLGNSNASEAAIAEAIELLRRSGVRERLEARTAVLLEEARVALEAAPLGSEGKAMLLELAELLARRVR